MPDEVLNDISHRRWNPLRGSWILVSPHRTQRPWQGQQESPSESTLPAYDEKCYLCPGNTRADGSKNPKYNSTFIFVNDYSAVKGSQANYDPDPREEFLRAEPVTGICYVLTFSPAHNVTLADLMPKQILPIINAWTELYFYHLDPRSSLFEMARQNNPLLSMAVASSTQQLRYMQIFENKGVAMGCSNPHPHGQIWITSTLPQEIADELKQLRKYRAEHDGNHMLYDYAILERERKERVVYENNSFMVLCPWWATWPFETIILPRHHLRALTDFDTKDKEMLADALADITRRYDNLFETQFPYSMGIHQAPLTGTQEEMNDSYFHIHFYPPLLRSATVRKFLVGYEMLAEPQRDITPEQAAARLRECGGELYRKSL